MVIRGSENRGRNKGLFAEGGDPCLVLPQFLVRKEHSSLPSTAIESLKPLVWLKSGSGFSSNHWFGLNRGRVLLQTIGLAPIGGRFCFKPLVWPKSEVGFASNHWFGSNRGSGFASNHLVWLKSGSVLDQTTWFGSNRGRVLLQTTWFDLNRGRVCFKPPGWAQSWVGFASNHLVWPKSRSGFASKAISILGLVRAESKDPAPARGGTGS